ncbi:unnamed protein product [Arctogadus glacialis]
MLGYFRERLHTVQKDLTSGPSATLEEAERVEAVMTPCKRPGPWVCQANGSDGKGTSREGPSARLVRHQLDQTDIDQPTGPGNAVSMTMLALWRSGGLVPELPRPCTKIPQSPTVGKLVRVGTLGRLPPVQPTIDPIENNEKIGRVGHTPSTSVPSRDTPAGPSWTRVPPCPLCAQGSFQGQDGRPMTKIRTVTGELTGMLGKLPLPV